MSQWFRFYASALNDPKVQRLEPGLFKTWVNLLCVASENGGSLPPLSDLAFALRVPEDSLTADYDALVSAGLIDEHDDYVTPHNWSGRQFQSDVSTDRVKRFRDKKRNVSETASETPPEQNRTEADTDTDTEQTSSIRSDVARERARTPKDELATVLDEERAEAVIEHRKRIRKPLTAHAAKLLAAKFGKCRDPVAAADAMIANGWQGFEPDWLDNRTTEHGRNNHSGGKSRPHDAIFRALAEQAQAGNGVDQRQAGVDGRAGADRGGAGADTGPVIDLEAAAFRRAV
jgi:hypothetical protein